MIINKAKKRTMSSVILNSNNSGINRCTSSDTPNKQNISSPKSKFTILQKPNDLPKLFKADSVKKLQENLNRISKNLSKGSPKVIFRINSSDPKNSATYHIQRMGLLTKHKTTNQKIEANLLEMNKESPKALSLSGIDYKKNSKRFAVNIINNLFLLF